MKNFLLLEKNTINLITRMGKVSSGQQTPGRVTGLQPEPRSADTDITATPVDKIKTQHKHSDAHKSHTNKSLPQDEDKQNKTLPVTTEASLTNSNKPKVKQIKDNSTSILINSLIWDRYTVIALILNFDLMKLIDKTQAYNALNPKASC